MKVVRFGSKETAGMRMVCRCLYVVSLHRDEGCVVLVVAVICFAVVLMSSL